MKKRQFGNTDEKEKARELSEAEQKRLGRFNLLSDSLTAEGYRRTELTISIVKANVFAVIFMIPVLVISFGLFLMVNKTISIHHSLSSLLIFIAVMFALVFVHELIHGASWAIFSEHHWKDIELGFMKQYLTPYCTCGVPLKKGPYLFGALMPLVLLGILPIIAGILTGSLGVLFMGVIMTVSAAGDIMIVWQMLRYKSDADEIVYLDHPTQGGLVIFEK